MPYNVGISSEASGRDYIFGSVEVEFGGNGGAIFEAGFSDHIALFSILHCLDDTGTKESFGAIDEEVIMGRSSRRHRDVDWENT